MERQDLRTKTYVAFDGDADLMCYRTVQGWSADHAVGFTLNDAHCVNFARDDSLPESIIGQLRARLDLSKQLVLIVGTATARNRKGILRYELNYALRNNLPIILVFKDFSSDTPASDQLWNSRLFPLLPAVIRNELDKYCLVCPFTRTAVCGAIQNYSHTALPEQGYTWYWV